jgi:PqqD family protein of HPr-rel-A system
MPFYRAPPADALVLVELDALTACYHRASGITHLLASPAPELLEILAGKALDIEGLLAQLRVQFDLADADVAALSARLDELVDSGLIERI